jgi:serine/threonine-protein kinase
MPKESVSKEVARDTPDLELSVGDSQIGHPPLALLPSIQVTLEKVLSSQIFHAAHGQRAFLRYVVEQAIAGNGHLLKEYVIGTEALGRSDSFDPRLDPIVRTQARKLRARLEKYYETEGANDLLRIDFPKGSYLPLFRTVEPPVPAAQELPEPPADDVFVSPAEFTSVPVSQLPSPSNSSFWKMATVCLALLLLLISGLSVYFLRFAHAGPIVAENATLAVLPFVNLGNAKEDEFLSDGMTDELIYSLRAVKGLQVVAHTSAFRFKSSDVDVKEVGRKLNVRTVLVGSMRRSNGRLRVTVQLDSVPNGYHLWTGSYDREPGESRAIELEICKAVGNVLGMALTNASGDGQELTAMLSRRPLPSPNAHESYLKGLYAWNKLTPDGVQTASRYFEEAILQDPSFARAYAALADCYVMAPQVDTASPLQVAAKIKDVASKALALDESLGEAHVDLAVSAEYEFDWARAESEFKKGLALSPGNAIGHLWYAKYLSLVGRKDEVLAQRRLAADLDPVSPYAAQSVAGFFAVMGRYDAAISQFRNALALEPNFGFSHQGLGITYLLAGKHSEALQELRIAQQSMGGPRRMALLAYAYAVCGERADAQRILDGFLEQARHEPFPALAIADVYIGLGDKDHAFEWLEKAVDQRDINLDLQWDPLFNPVRPDPRYAALLHRMKLA